MEDGSCISFFLTALAQPSASSASFILNLLVLFFLILVNAFFSAAEIAVITLNDNKIRRLADEGDKIARKLVQFINEPSGFLATIQVGITLAGFLSSALAADMFADQIYQLLGVDLPLLRTGSVVLVTIILAYFSLVLGELVPKRMAQQNPEKLANSIAGIITATGVILKPFVLLLTASTNLVLRILGIDPSQTNSSVTEEEIRMMVDVGREMGAIHEAEKEMINKIFEFNDKEVSEMMTHRTNIVSLDVNADYADVLEVAIKEKYSRIPVYDENIDNIVGVLHIKDLLFTAADGLKAPFDLRNMIRPPYFVPESKRIDELFRQMQHDHVQLAVIIDEYGGTAGIVTIEDLLEEIVGNIQDEYDEEEQEIVYKADRTWLVAGLAALDEVADELGVNFPEDDFDTMSGFVTGLLGRIPDEDDLPTLTYANMQIKVLAMDEKRISKLEITVLPESSDE